MFEGKDILVIGLSYSIGCFSTGYYLVRFWTGTDIRKFGSGATGARNVSRLLGKTGFVITFLGDFLKGLITVWLASMLTKQHWVITASLLAVVIGHILPAQLSFHGGKGIATVLGGGIFFDWYNCSAADVFGVAFLAIMILFAHRKNLSALLRRRYFERAAIGQNNTGGDKNESDTQIENCD